MQLPIWMELILVTFLRLSCHATAQYSTAEMNSNIPWHSAISTLYSTRHKIQTVAKHCITDDILKNKHI